MSGPSPSDLSTVNRHFQRQQQLWCPLWALAMELLDLQQNQPDCGSSNTTTNSNNNETQLQAPAPLPYLLAPDWVLEAAASKSQEQTGEQEEQEEREKSIRR